MTAKESDSQAQWMHWMRRALWLAGRAEQAGEVPVGAVLIVGGQVIAEDWNRTISGPDPTAHAEIGVLRQAAGRLGNYRLPEATVVVTLEPCAMCAGALIHSRVSKLIFAAREPKTGAVVSCTRLLDEPWHNHKVHWQEAGGEFAARSAALLRQFFARRRRAVKPGDQLPKPGSKRI